MVQIICSCNNLAFLVEIIWFVYLKSVCNHPSVTHIVSSYSRQGKQYCIYIYLDFLHFGSMALFDYISVSVADCSQSPRTPQPDHEKTCLQTSPSVAATIRKVNVDLELSSWMYALVGGSAQSREVSYNTELSLQFQTFSQVTIIITFTYLSLMVDFGLSSGQTWKM